MLMFASAAWNVVALSVVALTVPVKLGNARLAFRFRAFCVAVQMGLAASLVSSTSPRPTIDLVIPDTVPVKVGDAKGA